MTLLGIDIGTSACKITLFEQSGDIVASATRTYPTHYPKAGWAEQDPNDWWSAVCAGIQEILTNTAISPHDIAAIGIDGQSWAAVALDAYGESLCRTPIWMDTRADDICRRWKESVGDDAVFALSGNPLSPTYSTPKLGWYQAYAPDIYRKTRWFLQSNGFIAYRLTGAATLDVSQGYGYHFFNIRTGSFDTGFCRELGLDPEKLPEIVPCHAIVGTVSAEAARQTGLCSGIPVAAGGLDAACGTLGVGVTESGQTQEQGGQAGGMSICLDQCLTHPRLISGFHVVPDRWLLQGGTVGGGGVIKWFDQEFGNGDLALLDRLAAEVPAGSDGMVFLPYMAGERSPLWDPLAKGVYYGLDFGKTKGHFVRASLEGVAYSLRHNLETAGEAGAKAMVLYTAGGAARSPLWMQIKSDVTGLPMYASSGDTATSLGAALLGGVGVGMYNSFSDAVSQTVRSGTPYTPNNHVKAAYADGYALYRSLYPQLKSVMWRSQKA